MSLQSEQKSFASLTTILLVDDDSAIRNLFSYVLQGMGYAVLAATDGQEAVEVFKEHQEQVNLLLTDLSMPRKNGVDLARELKGAVPQLPVIFMTGDPSQWQGQLDSVPCLQKPFTPTDLLAEVENVLQQLRTHRSPCSR